MVEDDNSNNNNNNKIVMMTTTTAPTSDPAVGESSSPLYHVLKGTSLLKRGAVCIVQELCESRGGRPGLSVLTRLPVSVDVKNY